MGLRELTAEKHKRAESMPFNQLLMSGSVSIEDYSLFLKSQLAIFTTIENGFGLPYLEMGRQDNILDDLTEFGVIDIGAVGTKTKEYCDYLAGLDNDKIMPHIYLNYMALMMGGQMMKRVTPGSGRMYEFGDKNEVTKYVASIREHQSDEWADEVNIGYDFMIAILDELNSYVGKTS